MFAHKSAHCLAIFHHVHRVCPLFIVDRSGGFLKSPPLLELPVFFTFRCEGYKLKLSGIHSNQLGNIYELTQVDGRWRLVLACYELVRILVGLAVDRDNVLCGCGRSGS
jgi:hypothetical protein